MFLDFMKPDRTAHRNHDPFPGVILLSAPLSNAAPVEVVAYAIGDFEVRTTAFMQSLSVSFYFSLQTTDAYEVVTAWTSENYRNMNLAMTVRPLLHAPCCSSSIIPSCSSTFASYPNFTNEASA